MAKLYPSYNPRYPKYRGDSARAQSTKKQHRIQKADFSSAVEKNKKLNSSSTNKSEAKNQKENKEKIPRDLDVQAQDWGYEQATGKTGTRWMQYQKGDFEADKGKKYDPESDSNDEYASGWEETEQYNYEKNKRFGFLSDLDGEERAEAESEINASFESGYVAGMREIEGDNKHVHVSEDPKTGNQTVHEINDETGHKKELSSEESREKYGVVPKENKKDFSHEMKEKDVWTERDVNLIKRRMNDKKIKHDDVFKDDGEGHQLTPEQQEKGWSWLRNQYKTPNGVERKNNPFGEREMDIIDNPREIRCVGFYNAGNAYVDFHVPLYRAYSKDGDYMEYYVSGGQVHVIG